MNDSKTPKIVVGVGLVAAYSAIAFYLMRDKPDIRLAQDPATASAAQPAVDEFASPAMASPAADLASGMTEVPAMATGQAAVVTEAPSPALRPATSNAADPEPRAQPAEPRAQAAEPPAQVVEQRAQLREQASPSAPSEVPTQRAETAAPDLAGELASAEGVPADPAPATDAPAETAAPGQIVGAPAGNDSQITADVKAEIAAVAPAGTIEVSTTDGVVALTGSVHSHEEAEQVRMAAHNVPAVRSVDVSALMVGN